jgi:type II secretory pathway pseudopilin PulG
MTRRRPSVAVAAVYDRRRSGNGGHRPPLQHRRDRRAAFTLVELLTVCGVIVLLIAGVGIALSGRGSEGTSLATAQNILSGAVSAARAQAALNQTNARLLVYAQMPAASTDLAKYLRMLQVVREEPMGSGNYYAVSEPITLPTPICVVPTSPVPTDHLNTGVTWNNTVATGPVSVMAVATGVSYFGRVGGTARQFFGTQGTSGRVFYVQFDPTGVETGNTTAVNTKIALTTAVLNPTVTPVRPKFNNRDGVRGLFIRKSGAISFVNDAASF